MHLLLLAIICYQVAYGTNESSYKYGYNAGRNNPYSGCLYFDGDCDDAVHDSCQLWNTVTSACVDGFVNSWKHWCSTDMITCAKLVVENAFPGTLANNQTRVTINWPLK
ncbi:MAG: hypothetical protein WA323_27290 [Candidatus Nitrosopolaris sp.]